jgi:hypothetical protein
MIISTFRSVNKAYIEDVINEDWDELAELFLTHMPAENKSDVPLYNLVEFKKYTDPGCEPGRLYDYKDGMRDPSGSYQELPTTVRRSKANVVALWGIVLDVDEKKTIEETMTMLDGLEYVLYTTFRHTPAWHKFRVIIPFSEPLLARDIDGRKEAIMETFPDVDNASFTVSQSFYFHSGNVDPIVHHNEGTMINPYAFEYREPKVYVPSQQPAQTTAMEPEFAEAYKKAVYASLKTCSGLHYAGKGRSNKAALTLVSICKSIDMDYATFDNLCLSISAPDSQLQHAATRAAVWSGWQGNKIRRENRDEFIKEWGGKPVQVIMPSPIGPQTGSEALKMIRRNYNNLLKFKGR